MDSHETNKMYDTRQNYNALRLLKADITGLPTLKRGKNVS